MSSTRNHWLTAIYMAMGGGLAILSGGFLWGMWGTLLTTGLVVFLNGWFIILRGER